MTRVVRLPISRRMGRTSDETTDNDGSLLSARDYEEAETRVPLHVSNMPQNTTIVHSRDTDVLVLLAYHRERLPARQFWTRTRQYQRRFRTNGAMNTHSGNVLKELLAFHSLNGSDTISFFYGRGRIVHGETSPSTHRPARVWEKPRGTLTRGGISWDNVGKFV